MRALGAQEALNLDGGDTTGERPVGDAVVIPPASSP